jgi:TPR repeat protein
MPGARQAVLALAVTLLATAGCDKRRAPPPPVEGNPQEAPSAITIANMFGTCDDAGACDDECDAGSAESCRKLGTTYQFGTKSTQKDDLKALHYYERACAMKNAGGCVSSGQMYEFHHGVDKDDAKAAAFYKQGCDLGYQVGCANYAIMLENGRGVPKDLAQAAALFDVACKQGAGLACDRLRVLRDLDGGGGDR